MDIKNVTSAIRETTRLIHEQATFILSCILIRELGARLNLSHSAAAELVGAMTINVDNDAYHANPEAFQDAAVAFSEFVSAMHNAYANEFGVMAAYSLLKQAARNMSFTYNF